jgi:hypothetical protein
MAVKTPRVAGSPNTIYWGTKGALLSPTGISGVIIEDVSITPKNAGPLAETENGDGATVNVITLDDGFDAKIKATYDKAKTWPDVGDAVVINLPTVGAAGGVTSYACILTSIPPELKRKDAARIELALCYRPGVDPTTVTNVSNLA